MASRRVTVLRQRSAVAGCWEEEKRSRRGTTSSELARQQLLDDVHLVQEPARALLS
jgi:hypothetical protein